MDIIVFLMIDSDMADRFGSIRIDSDSDMAYDLQVMRLISCEVHDLKIIINDNEIELIFLVDFA